MLVKIGSTGSRKRVSPVLNNYGKNPLKTVQLKTSATYIKLKLKNKEIGAIVDSGAESTIINKNLAEKLKLKIAKYNSDVKYIAKIYSTQWTKTEYYWFLFVGIVHRWQNYKTISSCN